MITLHRAPWVLPISSPAIADGAVIVDDTEILAVGSYADLRLEAHDRAVDHESRILMPGLVNCHCHLELSPFAACARHPVEPGDMPAWIADLLALRAGKTPADDDATLCNATLKAQYGSGVDVLVDIGNALSPVAGSCVGIDVQYFTELLGLSKYGSGLAMQTLGEYPVGHNFTCHAAYSTSSALLQAVKKRAHMADQLYPIHVAESLDELEFLQTGQGRFRIFLEERGVWDGSFTAPGAGAVTYLDQLGVLDARTLCVHAVHLDDDEIELVAQKKAKVCLCPGSNRFLGVGQAQPEKLLAKGIRPCLGTDSLASNPELSMWREMAIVADEHPGLDPATVLAMATLHGAEAVGALRKGRLAAGCASHILGVLYTGHQPLEFLVTDHGMKEIVWL